MLSFSSSCFSCAQSHTVAVVPRSFIEISLVVCEFKMAPHNIQEGLRTSNARAVPSPDWLLSLEKTQLC